MNRSLDENEQAAADAEDAEQAAEINENKQKREKGLIFPNKIKWKNVW